MNQERGKTRKKVLFLITKATFGGAQRYVYDLATNLPQHQYEAGVAYGLHGRLGDLLEAHGTPTHAIPSLVRNVSLVSDIKSYLEIKEAIALAGPDILHLNSSKAAAIGALAGRMLHVPRIIFTVHGWPFKENRNVIARVVIWIISWITALLSTHVIVISRTDERIARRMPWVRRKVTYIPLGRENLNLAPPQEAFREMFGQLPVPPINDKTVRLVSLAELTKNKGLRYGIECVAELTRRGIDSVYVIAGLGEELTSLEALARKLGVEDRVYFPGFVQDAARYLSGFDVYLLPSVKEGMPYVLMEAALAGLPIVATSVIDPEFAEGLPHTKIVPPKNALALADAVVELSGRSRTAVGPENPFPLTEMINKTLDLYS